ncbi:PPE family protein [Mycobacterium sp. pUA109]|uniref:PPE family protein n=1 Tax=Mycobacterium sp. pUA109 TaxID=3238982 RepID=UPI00351BE664
MDFGALPPEINSARMYAGAGPGPLMAAAAAWNSLAAELDTTATSCHAVVAELTGADWLGPASASMATAVTPYLGWMNATAAATQHAAAQAMASAAAFETAFAMTVPPPVIATNRAALAALTATNVLGQNTPAIAANEALYGEMWSQDAAAMYGYAGSSATAGTLNPLATPTPVTNPAGLAGQTAAVGQAHAGAATAAGHTEPSQLLSHASAAMQGLASPLNAGSGVSGLSEAMSEMADGVDSFFGIPLVSNATNGAVNTAAWFVMAAIPNAVSLSHTLAGAAPAAATAEAVAPAGLGAGLGAVVAGAAAPAGSATVGGAPVLAGMAQAATVGGLSVPTTWSAATPPTSADTAAWTGTGWTAAAEDSTPTGPMPAGMPSAASASRGGFGLGAPRYGVKPTVMPRPVGVG